MSAPRSGRSARKRGLFGILALLAALLALAPMSAYGDSGDDPAADAAAAEATDADRFTVSAAEATALRAARPAKAKGPRHGELGLRVLSNRADLISGGDALVEVLFPHRFTDDNVTVTLNGADVTSAFALRADDTFSGLLSGLVLGDNEVVARSVPTSPKSKTKGPKTARLTITNHPASGPVFAGEQLQPWVCAQPVATPTVVTIPGHEPDRDRQLAGQRPRRDPRTRTATRRRSTPTGTSRRRAIRRPARSRTPARRGASSPTTSRRRPLRPTSRASRTTAATRSRASSASSAGR